jgi:hypothetical protein
LHQQKSLPDALDSVREIEWIAPDPISKVWAKYIHAPISINSQGEYHLELMLLSQNDSALVAVVQYHLIHIKSKNSVWELGRTFTVATP